ncbi:MAG: hypothetical protein IJY18_03825 [Clostridia bacterium]|nr:hypothetical protein [Clostridia bacterium]
MKKIMNKVIAMLLMLVVTFVSLPIATIVAGAEQIGEEIKAIPAASQNTADLGYITLSDGFVRVRVSTKNGGFQIATEEGDSLTKTDNGKDLVYSDSDFDTSFTSFRITKNGKTSDYIFGRDYTPLGIETSEISVYKSADNAVVAEWSIDGILIKQTVALMGEDSYQHGMAYIAYTATNMTDDTVDKVEARVLMDTVLGATDYAYYMLAQSDGSYVAVDKEKSVAGDAYYNYFFAYDSKTSPTVTAYTLNSSVNGEAVKPDRVTFAHWANLASTVYDYTPSASDPLDFTNPTASIDHLTADSAVALYYGMGGSDGQGDLSAVSLYYGVYSNYSATEAEVALNFTSSGSMFLNEKGDAYTDQNGTLPGNFSTTLRIQNTTDKTISKLAVAIYPEEELYPHNGHSFVTDFSVTSPYYKEIRELKAGEGSDVRFDFRIDPTYATGYRKIKIVIYNTSAESSFGDKNTVLEDELFVLCPGADGSEIGFTGMTPEKIFMKGKRFAYITGTNFGLIRDKSQYRIILRPLSGGSDIVLDQDKVVINPEKNTATLVLDMELDPTTYEVIIDWNDVSTEDMTSDALRLIVTDVPSPGDPGFVSSGVYGIITVERDGKHYDIVSYESEDAFRNSTTAPEDIMLVFRGDFNLLSSEEQGNFKAEGVTLMAGDILNISDTLDVKNGRVTVTKCFDALGNQTEITVDIEGKVYTTKANTKVWDGILAITSFKEGKLFTLPVYNEQGELSYRNNEQNGEIISLLWPGAASGAQTLLGLILGFRSGQFALMKQGDDLARVVAFGASLDPSIIVPGGRAGTTLEYSRLEKKQLEMGVSGYTASQLRANDSQLRKDQMAWRDSQRGTLNLYMDDILFGAGGFIGFNTGIEVGIPAYADGLPYIQGTLYLKIINDYWEFGVSGSADMMLFEMEATLRFKSYKGIPVPDEISFFIGGTNPGVPVDPFGVFWIRGLGAGISNIYETFFGRQTLPPLTLMLAGEFAVFAILSAKAEVEISAQHFALELSKVSVAGITVIDSIGGTVRWYPRFGISFGVRVDILDCIIGEGSVVAREEKDGSFYFCGYISATLKVPDKIWFIGGKTIASAAVGIDTDKVWGSAKIIGISFGLKYYWGGGVDVSIGKKYNIPKPDGISLAAIALCTSPVTGETLYMDITNTVSDLGDTVISSNSALTEHSFTLEPSVGQDGLFIITYGAENRLMASDYKDLVKVKVGGEDYPLEWYDDAYSADHVANKGTNAIFQYDEAGKVATVTVSFTDQSSFGKLIEVETEVASEPTLFGVERLVSFDEFSVDPSLTEVMLGGDKLDTLASLGIYAEDENGALYLLADVDTSTISPTSVTAPITIPGNMQSGDYTIKAIGILKNEEGEEIANPMIEVGMSYVNPDQPAAPDSAKIKLSGNYTFTVSASSPMLYDGFLASVYEVTEEGLTPTVFTEIITETADKATADILLGGRTSQTDPETGITTFIGLEAGKKYAVSVQSFVNADDGSRLLSTPILTEEIMMVTPIICEPTFSIDGTSEVEIGVGDSKVDTVNRSDVTVNIGGVSKLLDGYYSFNGGVTASWDSEAGDVTVSEKTFAWDGGSLEFENLADGSYSLTVGGVTESYDEFRATYSFTVDTEAPGMLISSHQGGGFFSGKSITVSGIAEADAIIEISVADGRTVTVTANEDGSFTAEVPTDETLAYQTVTAFAYDGAGNRSMPFGFTLTNSLLGNEDLTPVILYNGREIAEIVSGSSAKQLSMAFKTEGKYVTMNEGSSAASRIEWGAEIINGRTASVSERGSLVGDSGAEGIVTATLEGKTAMVRLITVDLAVASIMLDLADGKEIYSGEAREPDVKIFADGEELGEGVDYEVSYLDNVNVGIATVIITATENGKCKNMRVLNFEITERSISDGIITLTESEDKEAPAVTVTAGGRTLAEGVDYTLEYKVSEDGKEGIVTAYGKGNYKGVLSSSFEIKRFDHAIWIIPTATALALGLSALAIFIIKKKRKITQ